VTLLFNSVQTVKNGSGNAASMALKGGADLTTAAGNALTLDHNGSQWTETARTV
jgi:hypothetical protein